MIPWSLSLCRTIPWSTLSKALEKSRYIMSTVVLLSIIFIKLSKTSDSDIIVLLLQDTFILFRLMASHLYDSFHSFVFWSILLPNISMSRSPPHCSHPRILLLRPLFFPSLPAHHMSSTIFSSPCHSIYTPRAHGSLFLLSHTHKDHHHISITFLYNLLLEGNLL